MKQTIIVSSSFTSSLTPHTLQSTSCLYAALKSSVNSKILTGTMIKTGCSCPRQCGFFHLQNFGNVCRQQLQYTRQDGVSTGEVWENVCKPLLLQDFCSTAREVVKRI